MKREEAKAKFIRGAEEMFEVMWDWGEEYLNCVFGIWGVGSDLLWARIV